LPEILPTHLVDQVSPYYPGAPAWFSIDIKIEALTLSGF
jgi:hypothetical protein